MKQRFLKTSVAFLALSLMTGGGFLLWPRDRITEESWAKIQIGMTQKEVEEILGGSGISDKNRMKALEEEFPERRVNMKTAFTKREEGRGETELVRVWIGRRAFVKIEFDQNAHVKGKTIYGYEEID